MRQPTSDLLHELQVHQIELEMQNEELRRDQHEIEEAHEKYVDLYDFAPVGYLTLDEKGCIVAANLNAATRLGVDRKSLLGHPFVRHVALGDADRWNLLLAALFRGQETASLALALRLGDGSTLHAQVVCERHTDRDQKPVVRVAVTDVSELVKSEALLEAILDGTADGLLVVGDSGKTLRANRRFRELWRLPEDVAASTDDATLLRYVTEQLADPDAFLREVQRLYACQDISLDSVHLADGRVFERFSRPLPLDGLRGRLWSFRDITERKRAEAELQASENRFRTLADSSPVGIFQTDQLGRHTYLNAAGQKILGRSEEEVRGEGWVGFVHPADRARVVRDFDEAIAAERVFASDYRFERRDGSSILVRGYANMLRADAGTVSGYIGIIIDITAAKAMEAQLALSSRLAAMGTLVTGVAHEINNPLAAVMADEGIALEVVREIRARLATDASTDRKIDGHELDSVIEALEDAQGAGQRIARIVRDLTTFGRPDSRRTRVRVIDVVNGALRWLPTAVARTTDVKVEDGGAPDITASSGQIEQVLLNLLTNAVWAMREGERKPIIVRLGPGTPGMVRIDVIDQGKGIEPAVAERIFEPFFTTHPVGAQKGAGLGLAISHAIVTAHGGTIQVESVVGKGSKFRIELPAAG